MQQLTAEKRSRGERKGGPVTGNQYFLRNRRTYERHTEREAKGDMHRIENPILSLPSAASQWKGERMLIEREEVDRGSGAQAGGLGTPTKFAHHAGSSACPPRRPPLRFWYLWTHPLAAVFEEVVENITRAPLVVFILPSYACRIPNQVHHLGVHASYTSQLNAVLEKVSPRRLFGVHSARGSLYPSGP